MLGQTCLFAPESSLPLRRRISVELVTAANARGILEQYHYLHRARVGRQLNYSVTIDGTIDGVITFAYPMMSADLCGVPSCELVEFARLYLHQNIPHTASCAIGKTLRRVREDWKRAFPDAPAIRLVVSWSDCTIHTGVVYKASNFKWLRRSDGKRGGNNAAHTIRGKRIVHSDMRHEKDCWIYWLEKH